MSMVKICDKSQVPTNGMFSCEVNGKKIFVANVDGDYFCCDSVCTHQGGPLEQGDLDDNIVTCPWHGAQFDVKSGKHLSLPAPSDIKNYKIEVREDGVYADLG